MAERIEPGTFVAIVGPSGAGKDSAMRYAAGRLAGRDDIHFVERIITRPMDPASERHATLDAAAFAAARAAGQFAIAWSAHGNDYALPATIDTRIAAGDTVIANVSRGVLPDIEERYADVRIAAIEASPDILAARLLARGRETASAITGRIAGNEKPVFGAFVTRIDNSSALDKAGDALVALILATRPGR